MSTRSVRRSAARLVRAGFAATICVGGFVACVDLFHSTDFTTLCDVDAAACGQVSSDGQSPDVTTPTGEGGDPTEAGAIDFCAWSAATAKQHAERACAWLLACEGAGTSLGRASYGECLVRASAAYDCRFNPALRPQKAALATWTCLANASSCDTVNTCLFGGANQHPNCQSAGGGTFTVCAKDFRAAIECGPLSGVTPAVGIEACVLQGRRCVTLDPSKAGCAGGRGLSCAGEPGCSGTLASECKTITGVPTDIGLDCAEFGGGQCVKDDGGVACAPVTTATSCTTSSKVLCDDDAGMATSCVGGKLIEIRCGALAYGCASPTSPLDPLTACVEPDASAKCTSNSPSSDSCTGNVLRSCAFGKPVTLDCTSLGLGACVKDTDSFARCAEK